MNHPKDQGDSQSLTERDSRLSRLYGKHPARGNLLHRQLEGRKYFDSGDYALSQARTASDIGRIRTGTEHPLRESVSHPSSPAPSGSNIKGVSTKPEEAVEDRHESKEASNLHQQMSMDKGESAQ
ncbi:camp-regulated phospho protein family protein Igo1 [Byssothecium circinans]|uniref:mRNA stability protein n=1 Tax=Byssothecium circinans TaxID=147558 RepID=A0A6A5TTZ0_9PLEO|nr:camp-regulated phospho protein family protein Igo1 [Byssothecium circinans]